MDTNVNNNEKTEINQNKKNIENTNTQTNNKITQEENAENTQSKKINIYPHLRNNILDPSKNCKDPLTDQVYYCLDCKISTCEKCSLAEHKNHKIVLKKDYINFNSKKFEEASKSIKEALSLENKKNDFIKEIETQTSLIHKTIDQIKDKKIKEIKDTFINFQNNLIKLNEYILTTKNNINSFYEANEKFFSIYINNDRENTIFLVLYELMSLCEDKTNNLLLGLNNMVKDYENYGNLIKSHGQEIIKEIENFEGLGRPSQKFDDFYWDVKFRVKTYNDLINKIQKGIFDIMKNTGDTNDLQEIVHILDSKNKKGIQFIFNQSFFNNNLNNKSIHSNNNNNNDINNSIKNNYSSENKTNTKNLSKMRNKRVNDLEKNNFRYDSYSKNKKLPDKSSKKMKRCLSNINNNLSSGNTNNYSITMISNSNSKNDLSFKMRGNKYFGTNSTTIKRTKLKDSIKASLKKCGIVTYKDIKLDDKPKYKYFTYSVIDLYNRLFMNQARKSFDSNARIFADYKERNHLLKDYIKPVIGSNEIIIFNQSLGKSKKIKLQLNKKNHGYEKFPIGCRHIYIDNKLYICGGVDEINYPLSICLVYNSTTNNIEKIDDMCQPHSYHNMEYLDNYDCFLVVGGENSKVVELFDIFTNKWSRLPDLNIPRANINIYFDAFTSEVYALFGLIGSLSQKSINNSETIEVLELNDISSGWCKVDYYKGSSFDLRQEFVTILPFTRTKLLIYGGKSVRDSLKLFGLYLIDKMELIKSDKDLIDKINWEQKKIKSINKAYNKMNNV